ncbi:Holliday junction resolvase RecU, partial [Staphylococcus aureus]|uniref:Holliday junction resolvase RecU n=1 Tax=Staphylococcus aureus TaxID=1280 RepID=UPI00164286ED
VLKFMNYPNRKPYPKNTPIDPPKNTPPFTNIHYPAPPISLQKHIQHSNTFYLKTHIPLIHKNPTPLQILNLNYPNPTKALINQPYFPTPSTTHYNPLYQAYYIHFQPNQTKNNTS